MKALLKNGITHSLGRLYGLILLLAIFLATGGSALAEGNLFSRTNCEGPDEIRYSAQAMADKIGVYQVLSEEALSLRSQAITFLSHVKDKQRYKQPLLGSDMRLLSEGAAELLKQRKQLWDVATAHECWLGAPIPDDPRLARIQAVGITLSLSAALTLYDNYLTAVALYREDPFLRTRLNQGDTGFSRILEAMGCEVIDEADGIKVIGGRLHAVEADMGDMPDMVPTLAVVAGFARGTTIIRNVGHLKAKESNRLAAVAAELNKMGVETSCSDTEMRVKGGMPHGAFIETYDDHRMAMSFAVAGLKVPGVVIQDERCVDKSFPDFWDVLQTLQV